MLAKLAVTLVVLTLEVDLRACGFNLEPRHSDIISDPSGDPDSYFGYALGFWQHTTDNQSITWLLVGAPRGTVPGLTGERVRNSGVVYKCQVAPTNLSRCKMIPILKKDENKYPDLEWRYRGQSILSRAWIGSTIAVEDKPNGGVAVCGPRLKKFMGIDLKFIPGVCYFWQDDNHINALPDIISVYPNKESGFEGGFAQTGMSASFLQKTNKTQLVLGSPGVHYFTGAISIHEKYDRTPGLSSLHKPSAEEVNYDSYMGYSVASARFHKDRSVSYIAGAPRATGTDFYTGAVYVVQKPYASRWEPVMTLKGHQMGEYFGAAVAVLDLDRDGLDDILVVGAPLHSPPSSSETASDGDLGVVYIYLNKGAAQLQLADARLTGSSLSGARFGSSLAVVGDLNRDGFTDLVVGAPYEGPGAVYLYHGQVHSIRTRYSQRITASEIHPGLRGFGISISGGLDIDGNSFNDVAVGSYETSNVVIIKSYPVIDFDANIEPSIKRLDVNADKFAVKACVRYNINADSNILQNIDIEMSLSVDHILRRAVLCEANTTQDMPRLTRQLRLQRGMMFCYPVDVILKTNSFQVTQPIELSLEYKVLDTPYASKESDFCKLCPLTDPLKPSSLHVKVPFAHGCSSVCKADLKVELQASNNGKPMVLGQDTKLTVTVSVANSGEPAYLSKLAVTMPGEDLLLEVPTVCYQDGTGTHQELFLCSLANPLRNNMTPVSIVFEVDLRGIDLYTSQLTFIFTAWSLSEEVSPQDNVYVLTVPIKLVSQVYIRGKTIQNNIFVSSKDPVSSDTIQVLHSYEVVNYGPSPVGAMIVEFKVPVLVVTGSESGDKALVSFPDPQLTIDGHIFRCNVDRSSLNDSRIISQISVPWLETSLDPEEEHQPETGQQTRSRRSVEAWTANNTELASVHVRHALNITCPRLDEEVKVVCVTVTCVAGPLTPRSRAEVLLHLFFYKPVLESLFTPKDAAIFQTEGIVEIVGQDMYDIPFNHDHNIAGVQTLFLGQIAGDEEASWIRPLSIGVGLLVFLLLVKLLSKLGFFRRGIRDKIEKLKAKEAAEKDFRTQSGWY